MKFADVIRLLRPHQWYKNLVIFLPLITSKNFFDLNLLKITLFGFFILIIISSANYILNDLIDLKRDKLNPEKQKRPLASGRISIGFAWVFFCILLTAALSLSFLLSPAFFLIVLGIFIVSSLYTLYLKNIVFTDIITISVNFVLRVVAGTVLISVQATSWLIVGIFFFSLFLVSGKRYGELNYLKENASGYRKTLGTYTKEILMSLFNIFSGILIILFALYSFSSQHVNLIWTLPLFIFIVLRYYYLILTDNRISRNPEKFLLDLPLLISSLLFILMSFIIIYI